MSLLVASRSGALAASNENAKLISPAEFRHVKQGFDLIPSPTLTLHAEGLYFACRIQGLQELTEKYLAFMLVRISASTIGGHSQRKQIVAPKVAPLVSG